jgi:serine/threonine-protein kinase
MKASGSDRTSRKGCIQCSREFTADLKVCPHDGTILTPFGGDDLVGTVLMDRYEILEVIGGGGMGLVYKARHRLMNRIVAIKMLHKHMVSSADALKRFQVEAQAASCLSLPNILTIYDFGLTDEGQPYMVMDYLEGSSLGDIIEEEGHLAAARALNIFTQVCAGLSHAHQKGIIHRDLKPSNIMLVTFGDQKDFVKIVDFGIAKLLRQNEGGGEQLTKTGEVFGSPLYMSPEQCKGKQLDARSDIYSLGSVMYRSLTGSPLFEGDEVIEFLFKQVSEMPQPFRVICPGLRIPKKLEDIVFKALAKEPENRWQSMAALKDALEQVKAELPANDGSAIKAPGITPPKFIADLSSSFMKAKSTISGNMPFGSPEQPGQGQPPQQKPTDPNPAQPGPGGTAAWTKGQLPPNMFPGHVNPVSPQAPPMQSPQQFQQGPPQQGPPQYQQSPPQFQQQKSYTGLPTQGQYPPQQSQQPPFNQQPQQQQSNVHHPAYITPPSGVNHPVYPTNQANPNEGHHPAYQTPPSGVNAPVPENVPKNSTGGIYGASRSTQEAEISSRRRQIKQGEYTFAHLRASSAGPLQNKTILISVAIGAVVLFAGSMFAMQLNQHNDKSAPKSDDSVLNNGSGVVPVNAPPTKPAPNMDKVEDPDATPEQIKIAPSSGPRLPNAVTSPSTSPGLMKSVVPINDKVMKVEPAKKEAPPKKEAAPKKEPAPKPVVAKPTPPKEEVIQPKIEVKQPTPPKKVVEESKVEQKRPPQIKKHKKVAKPTEIKAAAPAPAQAPAAPSSEPGHRRAYSTFGY